MSSLNYVEYAEARRDFQKKDQGIEGVLSYGEVLDYSVCFFHGAVCLCCIHFESTFREYPCRVPSHLHRDRLLHYICDSEKIKSFRGGERLKFDSQVRGGECLKWRHRSYFEPGEGKGVWTNS